MVFMPFGQVNNTYTHKKNFKIAFLKNTCKCTKNAVFVKKHFLKNLYVILTMSKKIQNFEPDRLVKTKSSRN